MQVHQDDVLATAGKRIQHGADNHPDACDKSIRKYRKRAKQRHDERKADAIQRLSPRVDGVAENEVKCQAGDLSARHCCADMFPLEINRGACRACVTTGLLRRPWIVAEYSGLTRPGPPRYLQMYRAIATRSGWPHCGHKPSPAQGNGQASGRQIHHPKRTVTRPEPMFHRDSGD